MTRVAKHIHIQPSFTTLHPERTAECIDSLLKKGHWQRRNNRSAVGGKGFVVPCRPPKRYLRTLLRQKRAFFTRIDDLGSPWNQPTCRLAKMRKSGLWTRWTCIFLIPWLVNPLITIIFLGNFYSPPCMAGRHFLLWWCRCERSRDLQFCWMDNSSRVKGYTQGWLQLLTTSHVTFGYKRHCQKRVQAFPMWKNESVVVHKSWLTRAGHALHLENVQRISTHLTCKNGTMDTSRLILWSQLVSTLNWTLSTSFYLKHATDLGKGPSWKNEMVEIRDGARVEMLTSNEPGGKEMDELWKEKWHTEVSKKLTRNPTKTHACWEVSVEKMSKCRSDPFVCRHSFELHKAYCPTNGNAFCELHKTYCPTNGNTFCESYNSIRSCHNCAECDAVPSLDLLDLSGLTFLVAALAECCVECVGPKSVGSQDPSDHGDPPSMRPPLKVRSFAEVGRIPNHGDHCGTPEMPDLFAQMWPESDDVHGRFWAQKWNHRKLSTSRVSWVKCGHLWYF